MGVILVGLRLSSLRPVSVIMKQGLRAAGDGYGTGVRVSVRTRSSGMAHGAEETVNTPEFAPSRTGCDWRKGAGPGAGAQAARGSGPPPTARGRRSVSVPTRDFLRPLGMGGSDETARSPTHQSGFKSP